MAESIYGRPATSLPVSPPAARFQSLRVISDGHWNGTRVVDSSGCDLSLKNCSGIYWEMTKDAPHARVLVVFEGQALNGQGEGTEDYRRTRPDPPRLSTAEQRVFEALVGGQTNKEIAKALHLSPSTVKFQLHAIFLKLSARNRTEAVLKGIELGLLR